MNHSGIFVFSVMLILTVSALGQDTKLSQSDRASGARVAGCAGILSGCAENQTRSIALSLPSFWMSSAHRGRADQEPASTYAVPEFSRMSKNPRVRRVSLCRCGLAIESKRSCARYPPAITM